MSDLVKEVSKMYVQFIKNNLLGHCDSYYFSQLAYCQLFLQSMRLLLALTEKVMVYFSVLL